MPPTTPPRTAPLPFRKRFLFATVVLLLFVSIPEALFRWADLDRSLFPGAFKDPYEDSPQGLWRLLTYDPVTFWKGRPLAQLPGSEETLNARGLRGIDFPTDKPANVQRVVCMGDSATFGVVHHGGIKFTYDPTYSAELERLLNAGPPGQSVEVINAGVIGYSTFQGLRQLKHVIREWQPDVITIRYGVNDHWAVDMHHGVTLEPRNPVARELYDFLLDQHSFQLMVRARDVLAREALHRALVAAAASPPPSGRRAHSVPLSEFDYNLRRLVREGRNMGAHVVLLTAPLAPLSPEIRANRAFLTESGYPNYEELVTTHRQYEEAVRTVAAALDVDLLDTSRQFDARAPGQFFTRHDLTHPNGDGHRAIAQDLAALLRAKNLVAP